MQKRKLIIICRRYEQARKYAAEMGLTRGDYELLVYNGDRNIRERLFGRRDFDYVALECGYMPPEDKDILGEMWGREVELYRPKYGYVTTFVSGTFANMRNWLKQVYKSVVTPPPIRVAVSR